MREFTNLQWPEAPFGADQRPFGHRSDMLAAFAVGWAHQPDTGLLPVAAATVYLRVRRHGSPIGIDAGTLSIGFRAAVIDNPGDLPDLLGLVDRALTRARRHAAVLAGHRFAEDLIRMTALSGVLLRGVAGVQGGWANRQDKGRGLALMVDTAIDAADTGAELDMPLDPLPAPIPHDRACCATAARAVLARCLAIGLTVAVHTGRYRWEGTFRVTDAIDRAAWDVLALAPPSETVDAGNGGRARRHGREAGYAPPGRDRR